MWVRNPPSVLMLISLQAISGGRQTLLQGSQPFR